MPEKINHKSTNELFVSYSRRDNDFVQNLIGDLRTQGIDPWFDQEDIDKGRQWWEEIKQGIIRANAFVFVISPDSLRSQVCHWELAFARQYNKRIVPFLIDDRVFDEDVQADIRDASWRNPEGEQVKASENWAKLQSLNFISSKVSNDYVNQIIALARTDFDYLDAHRRILVRANEWETKGKKTAFVLTGGDLKEAHQWLITSQNKEPQPHNLHREYISASQLHARNQRRIIILGAVAAIFAVTIAAIFGLRQNQVADTRNDQRATQQAIAERESSVARSRELATYAQSISSDAKQYDLALLLSAEAYLQSPTYEAYNGLFSLLQQRNRPIGFFHMSPDSSVSEGFLPSNLPELISHRQLNSVVPDPGRYQFDSVVESNIFSRLEEQIKPEDGWITSSLWSDTDDLLAIAFCAAWEGENFCDSNVIQIYDLNSGNLITEIVRGHQHAIVSMAFSPDNQHLATASRDGTARIWEVATGKALLVMDHPYDVLSVAYSPNGDMLATGTGAGGIEITVSVETSIRLWDANSGELLTTLEGQNAAVEQLQFSTDGTRLASWGRSLATGDPTIFLWDLTGLSPLAQVSNTDMSPLDVAPTEFPPFDPFNMEVDAAIIAVSDNGSLVAESGGGTSIITVKEANSGENLAQLAELEQVGSGDPRNYAATSAQFSPDSHYLVSVHVDDTVKLWNIETAELMLQIHEANLILDKFDFDPTGEVLAIGGCERDVTRTCIDGVVYVVDVSSAQLIGSPIKVDTFQKMFFNDMGQLVLVVSDHSVIWDISPNLLIVHACAIANRNLTEDEWTNYLGDEPYHETCSSYLQ